LIHPANLFVILDIEMDMKPFDSSGTR